MEMPDNLRETSLSLIKKRGRSNKNSLKNLCKGMLKVYFMCDDVKAVNFHVLLSISATSFRSGNMTFFYFPHAFGRKAFQQAMG